MELHANNKTKFFFKKKLMDFHRVDNHDFVSFSLWYIFLISSWQKNFFLGTICSNLIIDLSRMIHCLSCDTMFLNPFEFRFGKILSKDIQFKLTLSF